MMVSQSRGTLSGRRKADDSFHGWTVYRYSAARSLIVHNSPNRSRILSSRSNSSFSHRLDVSLVAVDNNVWLSRFRVGNRESSTLLEVTVADLVFALSTKSWYVICRTGEWMTQANAKIMTMTIGWRIRHPELCFLALLFLMFLCRSTWIQAHTHTHVNTILLVKYCFQVLWRWRSLGTLFVGSTFKCLA